MDKGVQDAKEPRRKARLRLIMPVRSDLVAAFKRRTKNITQRCTRIG